MKLVELTKIVSIEPIKDADRIELATVNGWQSVIKKGTYKVGDSVLFVPIDTVIQPAEWNKFLWNKEDPSKPIRVKTMKMKGVISQGIIFPTSLISSQGIWDHMDDPDVDVSIADMLGISKYEKPIPAQLAGQVAGDFPTHLVSKTDEDNLKSNVDVLNELKECDEIVVSCKVDGSSVSYIKTLDGEFKVCSRNLELKDTPENTLWEMARTYNIKNKLSPGTCIQGEIAGPKINGNNLGLSKPDLFVFNYKCQDGSYIDIHDPYFEKLEGFKLVNLIKRYTKEEFSIETIQSLQDLSNQQKYSNGKPAEGIVIRGVCNGKIKYSKILQKMLSVKIINQNFVD